MTIAVLGAIPGVATGMLVALMLSVAFHWPLIFSISSIGITVLASAIIGLVAGLIPALRAAKLDPIQALQA
jgi:putative ABC transport system permease protein